MADETVAALGRMGHGMAFPAGSTRPDMVTMGKGITGGAVPAGALVLSREIMEEIGRAPLDDLHAYRGRPLLVTVSTVVKVIDREGLVNRAARLGESLSRICCSIAASASSVASLVRGSAG